MQHCNRDRVAKAMATNYLGWATASRMAGADKTGRPVKGKKQGTKRGSPDWASGLKQLYDSVIEEPLPDTFKDLLAKLDDGKR